MQVLENVSIQQFNSFGIDVRAAYFARFADQPSLLELLRQATAQPLLILGGGSNLLFTKDFCGWVLKNEICGIEVVKEDEAFVHVKVGAGENWHQFVQYCIKMGWGGVENLSLIPGNAGASPIQNIGAYGVEVKDVIDKVEAWHIQDQAPVSFTAGECGFGYRESIFKTKYKGHYVILSVTFRLRKTPVFNISYGAIALQLEKMGVKELSLRSISDAVIAIRSSKLPDPSVTGNAGSFFKNPTIPKQHFEALRQQYKDMPSYVQTGASVKVPAGWLIEQCGWKGYRKGDAGCYTLQALVLVNYGAASGEEIRQLSLDIASSVQQKFGIQLEPEVNIL